MQTKIFGDKKLTITQLSKKDINSAKEFQIFINTLVAEDAKLLMNKKIDLKGEKDFLRSTIKSVKNKKRVYFVARDNKKVVGTVSLELGAWRKSHIGRLGIAIIDGYRGIGLGKHLMLEAMKLSRKMMPTIKLFQLEVYDNNKPAIGLYKKLGFKIVGHLSKQIQYKGKLVGEYIMIKPIK
jgi:ribosomal protein S18 acetylase RimI-like enzyme